MAILQVIAPEAGVNEFLNPGTRNGSTGFANLGAGVTFTWGHIALWNIDYACGARYGLYGYRLQHTLGPVNGQGGYLECRTLTNQTYAMSAYIKPKASVAIPASFVFGLGTGASPASTVAPSLLGTDSEGWQWYGATFSGAQANTATRGYFWIPSGTGYNVDLLVSGAHLRAGSTFDTFVDGNQGAGYWWEGQEGYSRSRRARLWKGLAVGGGQVLDLDTTNSYGTISAVLPWDGFGVEGLQPVEMDLAAGGKMWQGMRRKERVLTLHFAIDATGASASVRQRNLLRLRQQLVDRFQPGQPITLRWNSESGVVREISCVFVAGLNLWAGAGAPGAQAAIPVQLIAYEPDWREVSQSTLLLTPGATLTTFTGVSRRDPATGTWSEVGPSASMYSLYVGRDKTLYGMGWSGGADYYLRRQNADGTWTTLGVMNGRINAVADSVDGTTLYVTGAFTTIGGAGAYSYLAAYTKGTGVWATVGGGLGAQGWALCPSRDGLYVYVGGAFTAVGAGGATAANYIARLTISGATWAALGSGVTGGAVYAILERPDGALYVLGAFSSAGTLATMAAPTLTAVAGGSIVGSGRRVAMTALTDEGETIASSSTWGAVVGAPNQTLRVSWAAVSGATSYRLYGTAWSGADPGGVAEKLIVQLPAGTTSYDFTAALILPADDRQDVYWPLASEGYQNTTGASTAKAALYRPTTGVWRPMGLAGGLTGGSQVWSAVLGPDGISALAGGDFTTADGSPASKVALFNGAGWYPLGQGVTSTSYDQAVTWAGDNTLWVTGPAMTAAGGRTRSGALGRWVGDWNGGTWQHAPLLLTAAGQSPRSVVERAPGELLVAYLSAAAPPGAPAATTVTWGGSSRGYPKIYLHGPMTLLRLSNWDTGQEMVFDDLVITALEVVEIDLARRTVKSNQKASVDPRLMGGSEWLQLEPGINRLLIEAVGTTFQSFGALVAPKSYLSVDAS